jgi:non-specific serine/threonine protein kinase
MSLSAFGEKVKAYLKTAGYSQKMLARAMGLDPSLLSHKLNNSGRSALTHLQIREIIKILADYEIITYQREVLELLDMALCPNFPQDAWRQAPLNKLEFEVTPPFRPDTINSSTNPKSIYAQVLGTNSTTKDTSSDARPLLQKESGSTSTGNLPQQLSSFIGRHKEIVELHKLIVQKKMRLVSLVGAGGCGKTRLGLEVAAHLSGSFRGEVWFVDLAPLGDPTLVAQTIATTLGLSEQPGRPILTTVSDYLRSRHLLLVLDNCEHLIEECARIAQTLIRNSTNLQILTTSRETLGLSGEVTWIVPSLSLPASDNQLEPQDLLNYEAISLFIERANTNNPGFSLTAYNAEAVVQVCRELDGIPLALELAAARLKVLPVGQLAFRLSDRFKLLTGGSRTALPRHQTLKATVDWSYDLLTPAEQILLTRLSVFAGSWSLNAAEEVCSGIGNDNVNLDKNEILDGLSGLVNKSLLQQEEAYGEARYYFLETIRQYGLEKLKARAEEQAFKGRHLDYYIRWFEELADEMIDQRQEEVLRSFDQELGNIRLASKYSLKVERFDAFIALTVHRCWDIRGYYSEGRGNMEQILTLPGFTGFNRGKALHFAGLLAMRQTDIPAMTAYYEECLTLSKDLDDQRLWGWSLWGMGLANFILEITHGKQGNFDLSRWYYEQSLAMTEQSGKSYVANAKLDLSFVLLEQGEYEKDRRILKEADLLAREVGNKITLTFILGAQSRLAMTLEEYPEAHQYLEEMERISKEIDFHLGKIDAISYRGMVWSNEGKFEEAHRYLDESLVLCLKGGLRNNTSNTLVGVARYIIQVCLDRDKAGQVEKLACLCGAIWGLVGSPDAKEPFLIQPMRKYHAEILRLARASLDEKDFVEAFGRGQAMSLEESISYAHQALSTF